MLPAVTNSPAKRFTPKYLGPESRPLREEPTPFLWAISFPSVLELHVGDLDLGERLAVSGVTPEPGAAGEAVDPDLLALAVSHHFGRYLGALQDRLAGVHVLAIARQQHAIERHLAPGLAVEQRHLDRDAGLGAVLDAADGKDGVGHGGGSLAGA